MTKTARALLQEAMKLDVGERAELAAELLATLEGEPEEDVEAAWAAEIQKRIARIEAGQEKLVPWAGVRDQISGDVSKR